jgi:hypothetical protein
MMYLQFAKQTYKGQRIIAFIGSDPPTDPEATKQKIKPLIEQTEEYKKQQELIAQKIEISEDQEEIYRANKRLTTLRWKKGITREEYEYEKRESSKLDRKYNQNKEALIVLEEELFMHNVQCDLVWRKLRSENAVFFAPGNAVLIELEDAQQWSDLINQKRPDQILLENKEIVTAEEIEKERINQLAPQDKQHEKEIRIQEILALSMRMRSELEIQKDKDALAKAQEWYEAEKVKIDKQYTE